MERVWTFSALAVTLAEIDFLDPALAGEAGDRERGVRVELRPLSTTYAGSLYSSPTTVLEPAVCRIDLLESAPGAADRMHWHPQMRDGEPGDRVLDESIAADPQGWLTAVLVDLEALLSRASAAQRERMRVDAAMLARLAPDVARSAATSLERLREPWPEVTHDARGIAAAR